MRYFGPVRAASVMLGLVLATGGTSLSVPTVQAAVLSYAFSGEIISGPAKAVLGIDVGDPFSGTVTYDTQTKFFGLLGGVSFYPQSPVVAPSGMQLDIDGQDYSTPAAKNWIIGVSDNDPPGIDGIAFSHEVPIAPNPDLPGTTALNFVLRLVDNSQSAFSDESLPTSLSFDDFDQKQLLINFSQISAGPNYVGTLDSFSLVPEPATWSLALSAAVIGLGYARCKRRLRFSRASR